jgi:Domain of unknown function (DUF4328)
MSDSATLFQRSRSVSRVGRLLEILIGLKMIVAALALYWLGRELVVLTRLRGTEDIDAPEIRAVAAAGRFVFVVNTPLLFGTIFVWLIWQFFAHDLVLRQDMRRPRFGRWASVGWWFVPFSNLVMPYRVMHELWIANVRPDVDPQEHVLRRWWIPWDAQVVVLYAMLVAGLGPATIEREIVLHVLAIAGEVLFLICTIPAIGVVATLTGRVTLPVLSVALDPGMNPVPVRPDRDGELTL